MNDFLQSKEWIAFQASVGREAVPFSPEGFSGNGIVHTLPLVGKYLYIPRGPGVNTKYQIPNTEQHIQELIALAKQKSARWIRIEPATEEILETIQKDTAYKIVKAPHDMQPREIFVIDITKSEEELLSSMKPKTRYNIRLAEKRGVRAFATREEKHMQAFFDLVEMTARRKEISPHPKDYYAKFFDAFPPEMCQLFVAEYNGEVLVANICILYQGRAVYLHGGSSDKHRDMMAPFLLQWEQIKYAKAHGCTEYDFGGVRTQATSYQLSASNSWGGITRFKLGFSPNTLPITYPGSYDIVLDTKVYALYNFIRRLKETVRSINIFK